MPAGHQSSIGSVHDPVERRISTPELERAVDARLNGCDCSPRFAEATQA